MEFAGEVVQDLCKSLGVSELESQADFSDEIEAFRMLLENVNEYNMLRLKMTAEMADASNRVKALVIKAEDARLLGAMGLMRQHYADLYTLNGELVREYVKRANNHEALLAALKEVNHMIQKSSNLRVGGPRKRVVAESRAAIKA